ncbi:Imm59 family immunity protein [Peribacillus muralis]|uniref:Imm59 family immunity protein n=1 Tax=Peribacillus muralis TaxID=264697 RepID=UPI0036735236
MNIDDAKKIIQNEELENYCFFCKETSIEGEVVIEKDGHEWKVYTNDERATKTGEKIYKEESEALHDFIERIRGDKAMRTYFKSLL